VGAPAEEDLKNWGHHSTLATVPDAVMQKAAGDSVSFVFTCQVRHWTTPPTIHVFRTLQSFDWHLAAF